MDSDFFDQFSDKIKELVEKRREEHPEKGEKFDALLQS